MPATRDGKLWRSQFYYKDWQGVRRKKNKRGFKTKGEADEWERNFLQQQQKNLDISFENFVEIYFADMENRLRESTIINKRYVFDLKVTPYFKHKKMCEIQTSDIRAWQNELIKKGYAPTYLKRQLPYRDCQSRNVLIISSSYGLDPWTMLETVMLDDEYEVYMDELAADNKYLFHIFYDQPLIRLPQNANIDAEILFALSYINSCHALCKKGLKKTLIYHDENLTAKIRGKIDVSKNIKHNTARGRSDKFYCSYVDFTDDNIENRIVKAALLKSKKILKEKFSSEASVNGKINFCLNSLRHVKVTNISNTDINSSNVGGLYSYYKPAIQQARAILSLNFQSHNEKNGENEKGFVYTIPYTINMETLFEYYARTELKKALKGSEYRVEQYSKKLYLQKDIDNVDDAEKGIHLMSFCIPDIIIYKEDKPVVVIDAKYKLSGRPDRSDSHQLLSYVLLTGADRCGFVLPGEKTEVKEMVSTGDNYLPLAPRILRYYELLLGSKSDSSELQKVLQ